MVRFDLTLRTDLVETVRSRIRNTLDDFERRALAPRQFTAILPLRQNLTSEEDRDLQGALKGLSNEESPFARVSGIHSARGVILDAVSVAPRDLGTALGAPAPVLVFALICDGWPLDVLDDLVETAYAHFEGILRKCAGYRGRAEGDDPVHYLRRHRVRSPYFFSDTRQLDLFAPHLHVSASEIVRALKLRRDFRNLVIDNQGAEAVTKQEAFKDFRHGRSNHAGARDGRFSRSVPNPRIGHPFELSPFERPLDHEGMWIRRTAEIVRTRARRDARARNGKVLPTALRQVHAKHHGLLEARVKVRDDVPSHLQAGIFIPGAEYDAWVRCSSTQPSPTSDFVPDGRGFALKVLDVGKRGNAVFDPPVDDLAGAGLTQDFAMVSRESFFIKDARDYAIFRSLLDARPDGLAESLQTFASLLVYTLRRGHELANFVRTLRLTRHPLTIDYHTMVPVLIGPRTPAKISVRPTEATRRILEGERLSDFVVGSLSDVNNYLRLSLQRSLDALESSVLEFELAAHVPGETLPPVEDGLPRWSRRGARCVPLASVIIRRQTATSAERLALAERMVFTPWHSLAAHRPLGSLNRARLPVYAASAEVRAEANSSGGSPELTSPARGVLPASARTNGSLPLQG